MATSTGLSNIKRKSVNAFEGNEMMYGKIPPHSTEMEKLVLGSMMLEEKITDEVLSILDAEYFYHENHRLIFEAINKVKKTSAVDLYTVSNELTKMEKLEQIGGTYYLATLTEEISTTAHIIYWAKIVLEKYIQRALIRMSSEIIKEAYEPDTLVLDLINSAEDKLFNISNKFIKKDYQKVSDALAAVMERIDAMKEHKDILSGVTSGFRALDSVTNGWQKTDLIVIAARPGAGKTALALNLIRYASIHHAKPTPTAFFSLEMGSNQLIERLLSAEFEILLSDIKKGNLNDNARDRLLKKGIEPLANAPIYVDDTGSLNIFELRSKCHRLVSNYGVGLIIIDYLQLMSGSMEGTRSFNREQEISKISRELKLLAKELNVPIIALSQLNRGAEGRQDKKPLLSDLREFGAIEQDADMVILLYRPDYYQLTNDENGQSIKGLVECNIAKHRNGSTEVVKLKALLEYQKFTEWEESYGAYNNDTGMENSTSIKLQSKMNTQKQDDDELPPF